MTLQRVALSNREIAGVGSDAAKAKLREPRQRRRTGRQHCALRRDPDVRRTPAHASL